MSFRSQSQDLGSTPPFSRLALLVGLEPRRTLGFFHVHSAPHHENSLPSLPIQLNSFKDLCSPGPSVLSITGYKPILRVGADTCERVFVTVLVLKVRRFATGKNSQQGGGPSLKAIAPLSFQQGFLWLGQHPLICLYIPI